MIGYAKVKLNVSLAASYQKLMEVDSDHEHCTFYEKYLATDVAADALGEEEWRGYVVWICDEKNKQGFPMKQGILTFARVHLLLNKGYSCCREDELEKKKAQICSGMHYMLLWDILITLFTLLGLTITFTLNWRADLAAS